MRDVVAFASNDPRFAFRPVEGGFDSVSLVGLRPLSKLEDYHRTFPTPGMKYPEKGFAVLRVLYWPDHPIDGQERL